VSRLTLKRSSVALTLTSLERSGSREGSKGSESEELELHDKGEKLERLEGTVRVKKRDL